MDAHPLTSSGVEYSRDESHFVVSKRFSFKHSFQCCPQLNGVYARRMLSRTEVVFEEVADTFEQDVRRPGVSSQEPRISYQLPPDTRRDCAVEGLSPE